MIVAKCRNFVEKNINNKSNIFVILLDFQFEIFAVKLLKNENEHFLTIMNSCKIKKISTVNNCKNIAY